MEKTFEINKNEQIVRRRSSFFTTFFDSNALKMIGIAAFLDLVVWAVFLLCAFSGQSSYAPRLFDAAWSLLMMVVGASLSAVGIKASEIKI
jgi:hypothetical protein